MFSKKTWLAMLMVVTTILVLGACDEKEDKTQTIGEKPVQDNEKVSAQNDGEVGPQNGPQDGTPDEFLPLTKALEKQTVWFATTVYKSEKLDRDTSVKRVFVFENGQVKYFDYMHEVKSSTSVRGKSLQLIDEHLDMEDVVKMSDKEILKHAQQYAKEVDLGKYSLDIALDDTGNYTEFERLITQNGKKDDKAPTFSTTIISKNLFNTDFVAIGTNRIAEDGWQSSGFLLTRVDQPTVFELDKPDTKNENVTIEEYK